MDNSEYHKYLNEYVSTAVRESDGSTFQIRENLASVQVPRFTRHRDQKRRAIRDARAAFDEHRHWPLEIILSHLGVEV